MLANPSLATCSKMYRHVHTEFVVLDDGNTLSLTVQGKVYTSDPIDMASERQDFTEL